MALSNKAALWPAQWYLTHREINHGASKTVCSALPSRCVYLLHGWNTYQFSHFIRLANSDAWISLFRFFNPC